MNLLLDQGLPRSAAGLLVADGHDVIHAGDAGLAAASDAQILSAARDQRRTVVTLDADFHAILAKTGAVDPSVIWIRIEGLQAAAMVTLLKNVMLHCASDLNRGALVTVYPSRIRVRHLPVI